MTASGAETMSQTAAHGALPAQSTDTASAADLVERFLVASMVPDPETAATYMADDVDITFTGGRKFKHPREATAFNAMRYKWVKKKMERTDVAPGQGETAGETVVTNTGTLYGEWHDGTTFEGNRYLDRFVVRDGKIVKMDVWNDSAERILVRLDIEA
jgi:ketosteroid isomerase-like protein